jgi:hypothetical protein
MTNGKTLVPYNWHKSAKLALAKLQAFERGERQEGGE